MAQLSRPYQIALGVVAVLGLVWAVALRGHGSNPSEPAASTSASSTPAASLKSAAANGSSGGNAAAPTTIYHGAAPGVEGLTRAIAKAHGAVAESESNVHEQAARAQALTGESQQAAKSAPVAKGKTAGDPVKDGASTTPALAQRVVRSTHVAVGTHHTTVTAHHTTATAPHHTTTARNPRQAAVEHELAQGKTVILFFWTPGSSVDRQDEAQASALVARSKGAVALHTALASQVGEFGTITEVAHVYQTPTILIVNRHGVVSTLTGLTDVFALEQALHEAQSAIV